ncbi:SCO2322 family protein [Streptomyces sp. NPDC056069]|uniref:SCO2322 family protein n=1 Tax=Streptomyces sp. NPDC056069 TaxID=3345702 RepID=UPI0035E3B58B
MSPLRRPTGGRAAGRLAAGLGAVFLTLAVSAPAEAAGYRYWSFWENQGRAWGYATQGPATARPADGDVIGFRFAVSKDSSDASRPNTAPDFAAVCKGVEKKDGTKRVAVVVDFGGPADAPPGETPPKPVLRTGCPELREDATAAEALAAVAKPLRYDGNALLCGIAGYPAKGCGEQVALPEEQPGGTAKPSAPAAASGTSTGTDAGTGTGTAPGSDSDGPSVGLVVGGAAVVLLGTAGVVRARRRRG